MVTKTTAIMPRTMNSCSAKSGETPSIMIFRTAMMYHLAGTKFDKRRRMPGMFSTGNIMPERSITGIISPMPELGDRRHLWFWRARNRIPSDVKRTKINSIDSAVSQKRLPATGTCSTKTDSNRIVMRFTHERVK